MLDANIAEIEPLWIGKEMCRQINVVHAQFSICLKVMIKYTAAAQSYIHICALAHTTYILIQSNITTTTKRKEPAL